MWVNVPSLNRNIGKYQLSHIRDEVLFNTPDLQLRYTLQHHQGTNVLGSYQKLGKGLRRVYTLCQYIISMGRHVGLHHNFGATPFGMRCHSPHNQGCHLWSL